RAGGHHRPRADRGGPDRGGHGDLGGAGRRAARDRRRGGRHARDGAARGQGTRDLAGVPRVQAAQAAQEPDQGHLHPALPPHDPDRRVRVHVVRSLPRAGHHRPIAQLAEGTREVAAGNLAYKVQARADDEIGLLVDSFNRMTDALSSSKHRLEEAYVDLQDKHTELEDRRRYIETVLEAITTGVVSLDALRRIPTLNRAAARM